MQFTTEQIRAYIALIKRTRNLKAWDKWVDTRAGIVRKHIAQLRAFANKKDSRATRMVNASANELENNLRDALESRRQSGG